MIQEAPSMDWAAMATESTVASAGVCVLVPGGVLTQCVFTLKRKVGPQLILRLLKAHCHRSSWHPRLVTLITGN
uniref:Uncharacterized protein n=1 Tax=Monodon monoceros TaxID=40151 RepID=A0A8C6C6S4_MONMO